MKSTKLLIRPAKKEDSAILANLGTQTFSNAYSHILPARDLNDYLQKEFNTHKLSKDIIDPVNLFFIAFISREPCGYIKLTPSSVPKNIAVKKPIELERLYITNNYQEQGLGAALLDTGLSSATNKGYKACWLKVWENNRKAISFYKRKGFSQVSNDSYKVGTVCRNVILMVCSLEKQS
ncbi:MAG: GNAT family N-acetyltransferase [Candidatus Omnitrophota bacterium]